MLNDLATKILSNIRPSLALQIFSMWVKLRTIVNIEMTRMLKAAITVLDKV